LGAITVPALGPALAQTSALSECHALADPAVRLACYDRATGRASAPGAGAPAAPPPVPSAIANQLAVQSEKPASMIDAAWDFNADSPRYDLRFYHENYLLIGRYTSDVNLAPYLPVFEAAGEPAHLDSTEAKFQLSFKAACGPRTTAGGACGRRTRSRTSGRSTTTRSRARSARRTTCRRSS
jgi:phospholipase A1